MGRKGWYLLLGLQLLLAACSGPNEGGAAGDAGGKEAPETAQSGTPGGEEAEGSTTGEPSGPVKLVFATVNPSPQLKASVKKYESLHPNVTIELTATQSEFKDIDSQLANMEKYVTATNTALLAGKGPDLLELDLLPTDKYASRGLLADLNELMAKDKTFRESDYFANVLENSRIGGGLYAMPMSFYLEALIGDEEAIGKSGAKIDDSKWTWDEFANLTRQMTEKGEIKHGIVSTELYLLGEMVDENYALFVDEAARKAKFDSPAFTSMLERVKSMFDDGVAASLEQRGTDKQTPTYFQQAEIQSLTDFAVLMSHSFDGHAKLYTSPHAPELGAGGYFRTAQTVGINAASPNKEAAWEFIEFLVSEEEAAVTDGNSSSAYSISDISFGGFPINRVAYRKQIVLARESGSVTLAPNGPADGGTFETDDAQLEQLEQYLAGAVHPVGKTSKVNEIVTEESEAFFKGQKSAATVAKLIQSKISLYLNE